MIAKTENTTGIKKIMAAPPPIEIPVAVRMDQTRRMEIHRNHPIPEKLAAKKGVKASSPKMPRSHLLRRSILQIKR